MNSENNKASLERLLIDERFTELKNSLMPNIFDILQISDAEIRHSNFLAYLLNPNESHKLEDKFIKLLLQKIWHHNSKFIENHQVKCNFFDITNYDFSNSRVYREVLCFSNQNVNNRFLDILLVFPHLSKNRDLVIAIENKIYSGENGNQIIDYYEYINETYADSDKLFLYLTPDGQRSSHRDWLAIGYEIIKTTLGQVVKSESIPNNIRILIIDYLKNIKERILMENSTEIKKLCQEIYYKNQIAIDTINKHIITFPLAVAKIIRDILEEQLNNKSCSVKIVYERNDRRNSYINFSTKKINDLFSEIKPPLCFVIGADYIGLTVEKIPIKIKGDYIRFNQNKKRFTQLKEYIARGQFEKLANKLKQEIIDKYFSEMGVIKLVESQIIKESKK